MRGRLMYEVFMEPEINVDDLRMMARRAGLELDDDELRRLLPGVNRAKRQVTELRALIALETGPAEIFRAVRMALK
jgi:hypothetical protein